MAPIKTTNKALQAKLVTLASLGAADDLKGFVAELVPLDVTAEDAAAYEQGLVDDKDEWAFLKADLQAISTGEGVVSVEGDQTTRAVFKFRNPLQGENVDREVSFVRAAGSGCELLDWRAEG